MVSHRSRAILFAALSGVIQLLINVQVLAQPQFFFDALPELPGGASEAYSIIAQLRDVNDYVFAAGRSLDGDGIYKGVVWTKPAGQPWEIEVLPNPFGNTESSAFHISLFDSDALGFDFSIGGYANTPGGVCVGGSNPGTPCTSNAQCTGGGACLVASEASPQPVVWTGDGVGPWTAEVLPLPPGSEGGEVQMLGRHDYSVDIFVEFAAGTAQVDGTAKAVLWTRNQDSQIWAVQLLPDYGPGFSSEATSAAVDPVDPLDPSDDLLIIGGSVQTDTNPKVPCVWQEIAGGGFDLVELPMLPGTYLGYAVVPHNLKDEGSYGIGYNASIAGLADLYRGTLWRHTAGVWGAPLELPPLPGLRDSRANSISVKAGPNSAGVWCYGHSYVELTEGSERATLWEVAPDDTITVYNLNDQTANLPPGISLRKGAEPFPFGGIGWSIVGTHANGNERGNPPHADVLILLSETDCNANGMDDAIDLYNGTSTDANGNSVPDECEPRFFFDALPEPSGGASEAYGAYTGDDDYAIQPPLAGLFTVGRVYPGPDVLCPVGGCVWQAVVWAKPTGQPWEIEVLPNPFGNTESAAFEVRQSVTNEMEEFSIGGYANNDPPRVCVGGPDNGIPCTGFGDECPEGTCPSTAAPQPVVWTGDGVGPWTAEVFPLPPGAIGGQVYAIIFQTPDDVTAAGNLIIDGSGTTKAALWTRDVPAGPWAVELLPDNGLGLSSQANGMAVNPLDELRTIAGSVEVMGSPTNYTVPAVWEELDIGGFSLMELPLLPGGTYGYAVSYRLYGPGAAHWGSLAGVSSTSDGTTHAVLWQQNGIGDWQAPIDLGPLPGYVQSTVTSIGFGFDPDDLCLVGHSDNGPGTEHATRWDVEAGNISTILDFNDLTVNLPPTITLRSVGGTVTMTLPLEFMVGTHTNDGVPGNTPHADVLVLLSGNDCNKNGMDDTIDLYSGTSTDSNGNAILDECEPPPDIVWNPDPLSPDRTTRSLRFRVSPPATATAAPPLTAIQVTMINLQDPVPPNLPQYPPPDFSAYESATCTAMGEMNSCARWVGKPGTFLESQDNPGGPSYRGARLQCEPFYFDWIAETASGPIAVVGAEIAPSSEFSVQSYGASCKGLEAGCLNVSSPVPMRTRRYGDVEAPFNPPSGSTQPSAIDVTQLVNKFKNAIGALPKATAQLQPNLPELNADVNALDIVSVVDAVKQFAYPFSGPCPCPSTVTCDLTPCATPGVCVTTYGTGSLCIKTCTGGPNIGDPCINNSHCPGGTCSNGFCRDRCGRCTP